MAEDGSPPGLDRDKLIAMYYYMVLAKALAQRIGEIPQPSRVRPALTRMDDEGVQVAAAMAFAADRDILFLRYHDLGVALALGMPVEEVVWRWLVSTNDLHSGGCQAPGRRSDAARHVIINGSAVDTQILRAIGKALAMKWEATAVVTGAFCHQQSTRQVDLAEGLTFAVLHRLPTVIICLNASDALGGVSDVTSRVRECGMRAVEVDGTHPVAVYQETKAAVDRARARIGPTFLNVKMVRRMDPRGQDHQNPFHDPEEPDTDRIHDPVRRFRQWMESEKLWDAGQEHRLRERLFKEIHDAIDRAQSFLTADLKSV